MSYYDYQQDEPTRRSSRPDLDLTEVHDAPAVPQQSRAGRSAAQRRRARGGHAPVEHVSRRGQHPRRRRQKKETVSWRTLTYGAGGIIGAVVLVALMMVVGGYLYFQVFNLILPGVRVGDVGLGGLSREQATVVLEREWNGASSLQIDDGIHTWYASPTEFGVTLAAGATAQAALNYGHASGPGTEFIQMFDSILNGYEVEPVVAVDVELARAAYEDWADEIVLEPRNASIKIENGEVVGVPGVDGHELNVDATMDLLVTNPGAALRNGRLPVALTTIPPEVSDPGPAVAEAQALLNGTLTINAYDPIQNTDVAWEAYPDTIASWLEVEESDEGSEIVINEGRLENYLKDVSGSLDGGKTIDTAASTQIVLEALQNGEDATLSIVYPPTSYTVQPGQTLTAVSWDVGIPYWRIAEANPNINPDAISAGDVITIPSKNDVLPLPVIKDKRIVVDMGEQHAYAYENGSLWREYVISTGIDRSPTQPGTFQIQTHELNAYASLWDLTMPHFMGIYEAWPGFMNGFHGLPTLSGGQVLWGSILGSPASYGCIILGLDEATEFYDWAEEGTVVEIRQ